MRRVMYYAVGVVFVVLTLAPFVFWLRSLNSSVEVAIPGPAGELHLAFIDGSFLFGVFEYDQPRVYWWRPKAAAFSDLKPGFDVAASMEGWGVSFPAPLLIGFFAVASAWWFITVGQRELLRYRMGHGLCLNCGYDLRATKERCPECGTRCSGAGVAAKTADGNELASM